MFATARKKDLEKLLPEETTWLLEKIDIDN